LLFTSKTEVFVKNHGYAKEPWKIEIFYCVWISVIFSMKISENRERVEFQLSTDTKKSRFSITERRGLDL
jgi:hypothetical protein